MSNSKVVVEQDEDSPTRILLPAKGKAKIDTIPTRECSGVKFGFTMVTRGSEVHNLP